MDKLSKRKIKEQQAIQNLLNSKEKFTDDEIDKIYEDFNEAMLGDVTGHTTEKSFMKYVKKKAESHFRDFITIGSNR